MMNGSRERPKEKKSDDKKKKDSGKQADDGTMTMALTTSISGVVKPLACDTWLCVQSRQRRQCARRIVWGRSLSALLCRDALPV